MIDKNVKIYTGNQLGRGVIVVIEHDLYVKGWDLLGSLISCLENRDYYTRPRIALYWNNYDCVAMAFAYDSSIMAYCLPDHRRKGYAKKCVKALKVSKKTLASYGNKGSEKFWKKCGIDMDDGLYGDDE